MIRLRLFRRMSSLCLPLAALMLVTQCIMPTVATAEAVKVQVGTPIDLAFDAAVSGNTAVVGQQVILKVSSAVVVDGKTVVAAGAPAVGEVVSAKKSGMVGIAGLIAVKANSVIAVDGTIIALTGSKNVEGKSNVASSVIIAVLCCFLALLMTGQKAEIAAGSTMRSTVAAQAEIAVP